jgi:transposase
MPKGSPQSAEAKLDEIIRLLQHLLAIELARSGMKRQAIAKRLSVATATVVGMLRGMEQGE